MPRDLVSRSDRKSLPSLSFSSSGRTCIIRDTPSRRTRTILTRRSERMVDRTVGSFVFLREKLGSPLSRCGAKRAGFECEWESGSHLEDALYRDRRTCSTRKSYPEASFTSPPSSLSLVPTFLLVLIPLKAHPVFVYGYGCPRDPRHGTFAKAPGKKQGAASWGRRGVGGTI